MGKPCQVFVLVVLLIAADSRAKENTDSYELDRLLAEALQALSNSGPSALQENTMSGQTGFPVTLPDLSPNGFQLRIANARSALERLNALDARAFSHDEALNYLVLKWHYEKEVERGRYPYLYFPYTPYEWQIRGPNPLLESFGFHSDDTVKTYLGLLDQYPTAVKGLIETLEAQIQNGIYIQRDVAKKIRQIFAASIQAGKKSFMWPDEKRLSKISRSSRRQLYKAMPERIERANLALNEFVGKIDDEYAVNAPDTYGLAQYPGGKELYKQLVKEYLHDDMTPERAYERAWDILYEIELDLASLRSRMGWIGDRETFDEQLLAQQRYKAETPAQVQATLSAFQSRFDEVAQNYFCSSIAGYRIERADPATEAALTFGIFESPTEHDPVGTFWFNGSNLESRSLLPSQALIYHEIDPGHHRQSSMQLSADIHPWRRRSWNANFGEAWGEYAQILAHEAGLFATLEEQYARRLFNAMFPARAIADIGVNYFGYSFDWGLAILDRYTLESELQNRSSLARDTSDWHAQILPYSVGAWELVRVREKARYELGERFDIRRYHEFILSEGTLPHEALKRHVDKFIEKEKITPIPGLCG